MQVKHLLGSIAPVSVAISRQFSVPGACTLRSKTQVLQVLVIFSKQVVLNAGTLGGSALLSAASTASHSLSLNE